MSQHVGLDVSLKEVSVCVVSDTGAVLSRGGVDADPDEIAGFVARTASDVERVVHESGILAIWVTRELEKRVHRSSASTPGLPVGRARAG